MNTQSLRIQVIDSVCANGRVLAGICQDLGGWWDVDLVRMPVAAYEQLLAGGVVLSELDHEVLDSISVEDDTLCVDVCNEWREGAEWRRTQRASEREHLDAATSKVAKTPPDRPRRKRV